MALKSEMNRQIEAGGVPAVVRAKAILDFVAQSQQPPHVSEIARQLGLPKSSVHGLCNTLVSLGVLSRHGAGNLALGGHLMVWANAFAAKSDMITSFLRLWEETPELQKHTVTLSTLDGGDVTYIACKEGMAPLGITFRIGMRLPAAFTATGKAMLTTHAREAVAALYTEGMPEPLTRMSVRHLDDLQREIEMTRQRGYSVDNGQVREGMYCFGAAIMGFSSSQAIGGIAISVLEGEVTAETERLVGGLARAPKLGTQSPYYYRFGFGEAEVSVVSDGPLPLGDPSGAFLGVPKEEVTGMLTRNFLDTKNVVLEQNIPIINTGSKLIMFDTGMGTSQLFGPTTGRLGRSMAEAGIKPEDIDAIVCSHAHIDHIGGIVGADGKPLFPNAEIWLSEVDFTYWTDEGKLGSPLKAFIEHARKNLLPVRDRLKFFKDGQEFLPGITAISAPGHTLGHTIFMVSSGGKTFCFMGDLTHHQVLLLEKPMMEFAYDTDPKLSAQTRVRLLGMLADKQIPVMSYHFPWPGFGNLARAGEGFRFYSEPMKMIRG